LLAIHLMRSILQPRKKNLVTHEEANKWQVKSHR
jgi:hypothetical protein